MARRDYGSGSKDGKAWYDEGMGKDPVRNSNNDPGNSTRKPRQLDYDTLLNQGFSSKLPKSAK